MSLALAVPLHAAEVPPLAALLGVRSLPPQHAVLAAPTAQARIDVRVLEAEALHLRYGDDFDGSGVLGDRADATFAIQSSEATKFVRWLAQRGRAFPPTVPDVLGYLEYLPTAGIVYSGVKRAKYGIEALCRAAGVAEHVTHHRLVGQTMNSIARRYGRVPIHRKEALLPDHLRAALPYFEDLARTEPLRAARDLAMAAMGIGTAGRGLEVASMCLEQMKRHRLGLVYCMTVGKMLQHAGDEEIITVGLTADARICPVATYERYAEMARLDAPGPMFRGIWKDGVHSKRSAVSRSEITRALKNIARAAGLDPAGISAHSLRIGAANAARRAGLGRDDIKLVTRHKDDRVLDGYMRADEFDPHSARTTRSMFQ